MFSRLVTSAPARMRLQSTTSRRPLLGFGNLRGGAGLARFPPPHPRIEYGAGSNPLPPETIA